MRVIAAALLACVPLSALAAPAYGPRLEGFDYGYPVKTFALESQRQPLEMAYLDVAPKKTPIGVVVLLHGKNFCAATWRETIKPLVAAGYRVIAPDQVGFCKSSKPERYQYSFGQLADNTHALLQQLQLGDVPVHVVGHSMGGMLAIRYALMYPQQLRSLSLVNPIGLEDWKALGVPPRSVDQWHERELKTTADSIRAYESKTYYGGKWKPEYERWVDMLAGLSNGPGKRVVAWNSALIYDMIYTQPVVYEFPLLKVPTVLLIGDADTTAIGADIAPPDVKAKIGNYKLLGKQAAKTIPDSRLVEFPGKGHAPQMEDPAMFHKALLEELNR